MTNHLTCPKCHHNGCYSEDKLEEFGYTKCFSCGHVEWHTTKRINKIPWVKHSVFSWPDNYANLHKNTPESDWVYQYISPEKAKQYYIGSNCGRVFIPVLNKKGDLIYYQSRKVTESRLPKYISPRGAMVPIWVSDFKKQKVRVVTEDIMSAIKVSEVLPTASLMGTANVPRFGSENYKALMESADRFIVWLDGDDAGQKAAEKLLTILSKYAIVKNIVTKKDPKCLSAEEIKKCILESMD